jgi:hypothetical protein
MKIYAIWRDSTKKWKFYTNIKKNQKIWSKWLYLFTTLLTKIGKVSRNIYCDKTSFISGEKKKNVYSARGKLGMGNFQKAKTLEIIIQSSIVRHWKIKKRKFQTRDKIIGPSRTSAFSMSKGTMFSFYEWGRMGPHYCW